MIVITDKYYYDENGVQHERKPGECIHATEIGKWPVGEKPLDNLPKCEVFSCPQNSRPMTAAEGLRMLEIVEKLYGQFLTRDEALQIRTLLYPDIASLREELSR